VELIGRQRSGHELSHNDDDDDGGLTATVIIRNPRNKIGRRAGLVDPSLISRGRMSSVTSSAYVIERCAEDEPRSAADSLRQRQLHADAL